MKFRNGFVSNSSSSSFIVSKDKLTDDEISLLLNYSTSETDSDYWEIRDTGDYIEGFTWMDNDDFEDFLDKHNLDKNLFDWRE